MVDILNGLNDTTWDTASCAAIYWGATKVDLLKFTPSKVTVKKDKSRPVGAMIATKRTPGAAEVSDGAAELWTSSFASLVLPRWGLHGASDIGFVILASLSHPSVGPGQYGLLLDGVSFVELEGPDFVGDEKPAVTKLGVSVMRRYDRGADGLWKSLYRDPGQPSLTAQALLKF